MVGVHVDLEPADRQRGLDDQIRPDRKPVDGAGRPATLIEIGRHLDRTKRVHRDVPDFARKQDQAPAERVTGGQDAVDTRERVEASQIDLGLAGQALDRGRHVAKLHVLREEDAVLPDRTAHRQPRLERANAPEEPAESRHQVAGGDVPLVGPASRPNLRHARGEAAVFGGKRVGQDFDRLDALRRQVEIEVARSRGRSGWRC